MTGTEGIAAARSGIDAWKAEPGAAPLEAVCPIRGVLDKLGDKWSMLVILELSAGEHRFSELKRQIPDISQKMLTQTLRVLQRDGLVARAVHPTVPPAVSYRLTPMGESLLTPFGALVAWADENHSAITSARRAFDVEKARRPDTQGDRPRNRPIDTPYAIAVEDRCPIGPKAPETLVSPAGIE